MNATKTAPDFTAVTIETNLGFVSVKNELEPVKEKVFICNTADFTGYYDESADEKTNTLEVSSSQRRSIIEEVSTFLNSADNNNEIKQIVNIETVQKVDNAPFAVNDFKATGYRKGDIKNTRHNVSVDEETTLLITVKKEKVEIDDNEEENVPVARQDACYSFVKLEEYEPLKYVKKEEMALEHAYNDELVKNEIEGKDTSSSFTSQYCSAHVMLNCEDCQC